MLYKIALNQRDAERFFRRARGGAGRAKLYHLRQILKRIGHETNRIQAGGLAQNTKAINQAETWLNGEDAAKRGRANNRSSGLGANGQWQ